MVLKFCGGVWQLSRTEDEIEGAAARQKRLRELLQDDGVSSAKSKVFAREIRVVFDSKRPHGLTFSSASDRDSTAKDYACMVSAIDSDALSQAADYNEKCKMLGDYGHVLATGMHVRAIDAVDQRGVAWEEVVRRVDTLCALEGCSITFADVSSRQLALSPSKYKLKTIGNVVRAAQRATLNPRGPSSGPSSPNARCSVYNAQATPRLSKWSSVLTTPSERVVAPTVTQSDVLAMDLAHKSAHLEAQILILKGKLGALQREKDVLAVDREMALKESESLRQSLELQRHAAEESIKAKDAADRSEELTRMCDALKQEKDAAIQQVERLVVAMETLQTDFETKMLHMRELQDEHHDVEQHSEEIHARLVATQVEKSELLDQIKTLRGRQQREDDACRVMLEAEMHPSHRASSTMAAMSHDDSAPMALLKRVLETRHALQLRNDELQIELSCHEATVHAQKERLVQMEDELQAVQQVANSLRQQVRAHALQKLGERETVRETREEQHQTHEDEGTATERRPVIAPETEQLMQQLETERQANARIQAALQALSDKARAKLELHEKEQLFLSQFKEQLQAGIIVTKYGAMGNPHSRVLYSDSQCHWISWRAPSDGAATSPRADAKLETLDLVEVLMGARTETFQQQAHKPELPARCLSLVFCQPCRTLDIEVETRDRAQFLRRGFRLLLEEASEKRHQEEL